MRAWKRVFVCAAAIAALIFAAVNIILIHLTAAQGGRPYRVEINRLALAIEEKGIENTDLSGCEYVYNIAEYGEDFYNFDGDCQIREIGGKLYRFDYSAKGEGSNRIILTVNLVLGLMTGGIFGLLIYVGEKVLKPFERLTSVPYELSKGNLTAPVKESRSKFFGKFLWGIDLLREKIEEQKQRELELQREKKTLLLSLSHDIKTPLSAIKLYSKALSKNLYPDREKQREIAESINAKADEIEGYVASIITASREDFLSIEVENGEFYLSELAEKIAAYYKDKSALVKTEFAVGEYENRLLFGDPDRSVEVLQNLIENAMKYGDGKRVELLFPEEDEGVLVAVRNWGCGLDREELPHIFESFWRGKNSEGVKGSGLGLYICRQIVRKMNGEIFAEIEGDAITVTVVFGRA